MKRLLITGGSRGIGKAIVERFSTREYDIVAPLRSLLDLADLESIDQFIEKEKTRGFDILINNAGVNELARIDELTDENMHKTLQVNLHAPMKIIQGFIPRMKENRFGRIVNISSVWSIVAKEGRTSYGMSKYGLNALTSFSAVELGAYNILVNSVCPGYVNTDMTKKNVSENEARKVKELIPLKRFAEPSEIAELVCFLASEKNTYITGQHIIIDGGYSLL